MSFPMKVISCAGDGTRDVQKHLRVCRLYIFCSSKMVLILTLYVLTWCSTLMTWLGHSSQHLLWSVCLT